jgi:hypothetical protein
MSFPVSRSLSADKGAKLIIEKNIKTTCNNLSQKFLPGTNDEIF